MMILCKNWIMHCYFMNLNCMMLLNKMCCVDGDEFSWDLRWLDRVVKWNWKCNIIFFNNLEPPNTGETPSKF